MCASPTGNRKGNSSANKIMSPGERPNDAFMTSMALGQGADSKTIIFVTIETQGGDCTRAQKGTLEA